MTTQQSQEITEAQASFNYVKLVFDKCAEGWAYMVGVIKNYDKNGVNIIANVSHPDVKLAIAVLGSSLDFILNHSPLFDDKHEQAARIEEWIIFSLLSDIKNRTSWPFEETLFKIRKYQQLNAKLEKEFKQSGENPFGDLTIAFLCDIFGNDVKKLCEEGTDNLDSSLHSTLADIFMAVSVGSLCYWSTVYDNR